SSTESAPYPPRRSTNGHRVEGDNDVAPIQMQAIRKIPSPMKTFETYESEVRGYVRGWPTVFTRAEGWTMTDESGREFLDFFAGAGALNYGHNHPAIIKALTDYLA